MMAPGLPTSLEYGRMYNTNSTGGGYVPYSQMMGQSYGGGGNSYAAGMPSGVSALSGYGQQLGNFATNVMNQNSGAFVPNQNAIDTGAQVQSSVGSNPEWANTIMTAAMDPEQELFNEQMGLLTDQTRAGQAARGIAMSPYGAGVEAYEQGRFRNDWQDRQLGRMATGAGAVQGLQGQYATSMGTGAGLNMAGVAAPLQNLNTAMQGAGVAGGVMQNAARDQLDYQNFLLALGQTGQGPFAKPWYQNVGQPTQAGNAQLRSGQRVYGV